MISILFVLIDEPLSTTGKPATINDIGVGFLGLLVIVAIVWFIVYCLRFFVNNKKIKNNLERFQDEKKERIEEKAHTEYTRHSSQNSKGSTS